MPRSFVYSYRKIRAFFGIVLELFLILLRNSTKTLMEPTSKPMRNNSGIYKFLKDTGELGSNEVNTPGLVDNELLQVNRFILMKDN